MPCKSLALIILAVLLGSPMPLPAAPPETSKLPPPANRPVDYVRDIQPIFAKACYRCHGETKQKSGYRLDLKAAALKGGDLGRAILPGHSSVSPLIQYVAGLNAEVQMPPSGDRLTVAQIGLLRAWIDQGAVWPDRAADSGPRQEAVWWSLRPLTRPAPPTLDASAAAWVRNPIDVFILARLRAKGLSPSPEADRRTLIRRLYFDLIGLPPDPEAVAAFVADPDPRAYEKLVNRLLASPGYGERWARHWLDVVHYGETHGYDKDQPRPNAWPYRDYVLRSFNADKPYARFVQEQIAGDVLFPDSADGVEALGFIAAGPWDLIGHAEVPETKIDGKVARHLDRDDMVANTINTFCSLTVQCAQCHNHKFDPISQEDYYSLQAVFAALDRADKPYDLDPAVGRRRAALTSRLHALGQRKQALDAQVKQRGDPELTAQELTEVTRGLSETRAEVAKLPPPHLVYAGTVHYGRGAFLGTGANGGRPRAIHILNRGDVRKPCREVGPGALSAVSALPARFPLPADASEGERRAALARWLSDPRNPLTWRSLVNRVWLYHFGRGIVDSPNDFGRMGQAPTHPELLDWLAAEFRDGGGSLKHLHRLMVASATYRQASSVTRPRAALGDASNTLYWRMNRRRLEAEAIRDSVLWVSGRLDRRMYGPSFRDFVIEKPEHSPHYQYHLFDPEDPRSHRRSVYRFLVRSQQQPFMTALDCADPSMAVDKRNQTITPLQALALLNDQLMVVMTRHFADHVSPPGADLKTQVTTAFCLALARAPTAAELHDLMEYAQQYGLANACRVILNLNEFVFVD
jgi:mono/diheme cytochrome c family protein